MSYYNKKTESLTGSIVGRTFYKEGDGGKKSFLAFSLYVETKGKKEIRKIKAFGVLADELCYLSEGDKVTISTHRNESGEDIVESFVDNSNSLPTAIKTSSIMSEDALQAKNRELAILGYCLVPIKTDKGQILVQKKLTECVKVQNRWLCKLEYIMDTLGADRVKEELLKADIKTIKFSKDFIKSYKELKNRLFLEALEQ